MIISMTVLVVFSVLESWVKVVAAVFMLLAAVYIPGQP